LNAKYLLLLAIVSSVSAISFDSVSAHKSEIIDDYKLEIGWDREPTVVGVDNAITVMITCASDEEKASSKVDHGGTDHSSHEESNHSPHDADERVGGIAGLADAIDMSITLNGKKTMLSMAEDEHTAGLYLGKFTPSESGHPTLSFFAEIDGTPIETTLHPEKVDDGALIRTVSSDGTINVDMIATTPAQDQPMLLGIDFTDLEGNAIEHVNYALTVTQAGASVLSESEAHAHHGTAAHSTSILSSDEPVDVQVTILGIGLPDNKAEWTGPKDDVIPIHVTPEFGPVVMIVMGIALLILIATAKSKKLLLGLNQVTH
jgi:hypothetical protein